MGIYGIFGSWVLGKRVELAAIGTLIAGVISYAMLGITVGGSRVASAERAVDRVVSHQNTLNATFGDINTQLTALGATPSFEATQALALVDRSVANSKLAARTVNDDDTSLGAAEAELHAQSWLTVVDGDVDRASARVEHARRALAIARAVAADQIAAGTFWQALYGALADLGEITHRKDAGDLAGARASAAQMKLRVDRAADRSSAPGLPAELAALTNDLQKLAYDYGRQLDAEAANNYDGATLIATTVAGDMARIGSYNVDRVAAETDAYFQPSIARYNAEMRAATA